MSEIFNTFLEPDWQVESAAFNAGQTFMPIKNNVTVPDIEFKPVPKPNPLLPPLQLSDEWKEKRYEITFDEQDILPGVTAEMLDWFWANMEKCYYLWAPGFHKYFGWLVPPISNGWIGSSHNGAECMVKGGRVLGGDQRGIVRCDMDMFPYTTSLEHVMLEYRFNPDGLAINAVIHMWEDTPEGCLHRMSSINYVGNEQGRMDAQRRRDSYEMSLYHTDYEAYRWTQFLPQLYELWQANPDPSQNVQCDLRVKYTACGKWEYVSGNPVKPVNDMFPK